MQGSQTRLGNAGAFVVGALREFGTRRVMVIMGVVFASRILLRRERAEEGLTQAELARRLGMSSQSVQTLERSGANPTLDTLDRVASALNRTPVVGLVRERGVWTYAADVARAGGGRRGDVVRARGG